MTDSISFIEDDRDARVPRLHSGISLRGKLHKGAVENLTRAKSGLRKTARSAQRCVAVG